MGLDLKIQTRQFFDRRAVVDALGKANAAALSQAGAFIRRTAKGSIRSAKSPAKPGNPPHSHVGTLKNLLFFSFDPSSLTVVIGPTPFKGQAIAPRALELGGTIGGRVNRRRRKRVVGGSGEIRFDGSTSRLSSGRNSRATKRVKNTLRGTVGVTYARLHTQGQADRANALNEELYGPEFLGPAPLAARPYMGPALTKELPKLPPLWANSVR